MNLELANYFKNRPYEIRVKDVLISSLLVLFAFRLLLLFEVSKVMHHINIFTMDLNISFFSLVGIILSFFVIIKENTTDSKKELIFIVLLLQVIFSFLVIFQFLLPNNPINFSSADLLLILLQLVTLLAFVPLVFEQFNIKDRRNIVFLFIIFSFSSFLLSKVVETNQDVSLLLIVIANILFWVALWIIIFSYAKVILDKGYRNFLFITIGFAVILAVGMSISMTKKEVLTAVLSLILNQLFGLFVVNSTLPFFNFNPEFLLILLNSITGFSFIAVMISAFLKLERTEHKYTLASYLLLGLSGLSVLPVFGILRIIALYFLFKVHLRNEEVFPT